MKFQEEHIYDAPLETVERMYFDTGFCPRKYRELGLDAVEVLSCSDAAEDFYVDCRFIMEPSLPLPGFIKRLLPGGEKIGVRQIDRWNTRTREGELQIELDGLDVVTIFSDMRLEAHPRGAINRMQWSVDCQVPLVGGKLADFLGRDIQSKAARDHEVSVQILQDYL